MDDILGQYYEDLLKIQYRVSEAVQQMLPRGTIREDFLRDIVLRRKDTLRGKKGMISRGIAQSGECDLIFYDTSAIVNHLGDQIVIDPKHCKLVLEIKSKADGGDLKKSNDNFADVKAIDPDIQPLCGVFCYNTVLTKKTILTRFGYSYDTALEIWEPNPNAILQYPNIDFIICIACLELDNECIEKQFFLIKDVSSGRFILTLEYPIIKNFFGITDNL